METLPHFEDIDRLTAADIGIRLCREGKWERALDYLSVASSHGYSHELPVAYFSYFGLANAVVKKQYRTATQLCELAVRRIRAWQTTTSTWSISG
jgi:hypothetical protein